jgi:hypothetical protein
MDLPHGETGLAAFERTSAVGEIYCAGDLLSAQQVRDRAYLVHCL